VLLSFDGLSADELQAFGSGETFSRLAREGTHVERVIPVNPTATSSTHATILTGAMPGKTGIVANRFHHPGTPPTQVTNGLDTEIEVETLIEAARKAGKRIGCLTFPTVDATSPRRTADWGIVFRKPLTAPRVIRLTKADFHAAWLPPGWGAPPPDKHPSFSPVVRARIEWTLPQRVWQDVDVVAYDTTDDHVTNYDTFVIEVNGHETPLDAKDWFAVSKRLDDGLYGSWSKLLRRDPTLDSVTLYWGTISRTEAYPEPFRTMLDDEVGFWPGPPDEESARSWIDDGAGLDPDSFAEQIDHYTDFFTRAALLAMGRMPFDLLLAYQPTIDASEHQYRITNDAQKSSTPENRAAGERVRRRAYEDADRVLGSIAAALDPSRDALVVTGDHGLASIDTEVRLGRLLGNWSLAPRWQVFAGGNVAHFYRFGGDDDAPNLIAWLGDLKAPDGTPVFERVERKAVTAHPNSGDVIAFAYPRFALSSGEGELFVKPSYYGQHGGLNSHHEYDTTLVAWGRGVAVTSIPMIPQTWIARYVSQLLGIPPPASAE
jgi:hypothetical protein